MSANKTKWVRLGDCVEAISIKAGDNTPEQVYGLHKDYGFIPTVADMTDIDTSKYKIVPPKFFACNLMHVGRDVAIPIAFNYSSESLCVSPAYLIFGVPKSKETEVLADYLSIIFQRSEFGRNAWLYTDNSIRGNLPEKAFWDMQIPLPSIEVQQELVDTYNGLKALAEQNEALIPRFSEACQAYIVDCKAKYPSVPLEEFIEERRNFNKDSLLDETVLQGVTSEGIFDDSKANTQGIDFSKYKIVEHNDFGYNPSRINLGSIALRKGESCIVSPMYVVFRIKENKRGKLLPEFLNLWFLRKEFQRSTLFYAMGSVRDTFDINLMKEVQIPLPPPDVQQAIVDVYNCMERAKSIAAQARERLKTLCPALVQRAANA